MSEPVNKPVDKKEWIKNTSSVYKNMFFDLNFDLKKGEHIPSNDPGLSKKSKFYFLETRRLYDNLKRESDYEGAKEFLQKRISSPERKKLRSEYRDPIITREKNYIDAIKQEERGLLFWQNERKQELYIKQMYQREELEEKFKGERDALSPEIQKARAIQRKLLWPLPDFLVDAHPIIKEEIELWRIKVYEKQLDWSYIFNGKIYSEQEIGKFIQQESLYAIKRVHNHQDRSKRAITTVCAHKTENEDWILKAFELQGIVLDPTNYTDPIQLTISLKPLFKKYQDKPQYQQLFDCENRWSWLDLVAKQQLLNLLKELNPPKISFWKIIDGRVTYPMHPCLCIPRYFNGYLVCLWILDTWVDFFSRWDGFTPYPVSTFVEYIEQ